MRSISPPRTLRATELWGSDAGALINVYRARGSRRLRGLIASPPPARGSALLLPRCSGVHGVGVSYPIDLLFLDRSLRVLRVGRLRPWSFAACAGARHTLELRVGECARLGIATGDRFAIQTYDQTPTDEGTETSKP